MYPLIKKHVGGGGVLNREALDEDFVVKKILKKLDKYSSRVSNMNVDVSSFSSLRCRPVYCSLLSFCYFSVKLFLFSVLSFLLSAFLLPLFRNGQHSPQRSWTGCASICRSTYPRKRTLSSLSCRPPSNVRISSSSAKILKYVSIQHNNTTHSYLHHTECQVNGTN